MTVLTFFSTNDDIVAALTSNFERCENIKIVRGSNADVPADAEYVSISVVHDYGVTLEPCEAKVLRYADFGIQRDVPFGIAGGIVPNDVEAISAQASAITFKAVLAAIRDHNRRNSETRIQSVRILGDWFLGDDADTLSEQAAAMYDVYDASFLA